MEHINFIAYNTKIVYLITAIPNRINPLNATFIILNMFFLFCVSFCSLVMDTVDDFFDQGKYHICTHIAINHSHIARNGNTEKH